MIQDRMRRQISYIKNNLTRMTIQVDFPDMTNIFQGLDKIGNLEEIYKSLNEQSAAEGYIQSTEGEGIDYGDSQLGNRAAGTKV